MGIFLKSGVPVREGGRFTYMFEQYGDKGIVGNLEIEGVVETDEGLFTCYAYKAGLTATKTFTLKGLYYLFHHLQKSVFCLSICSLVYWLGFSFSLIQSHAHLSSLVSQGEMKFNFQDGWCRRVSH